MLVDGVQGVEDNESAVDAEGGLGPSIAEISPNVVNKIFFNFFLF